MCFCEQKDVTNADTVKPSWSLPSDIAVWDPAQVDSEAFLNPCDFCAGSSTRRSAPERALPESSGETFRGKSRLPLRGKVFLILSEFLKLQRSIKKKGVQPKYRGVKSVILGASAVLKLCLRIMDAVS